MACRPFAVSIVKSGFPGQCRAMTTFCNSALLYHSAVPQHATMHGPSALLEAERRWNCSCAMHVANVLESERRLLRYAEPNPEGLCVDET